MAFTLLHTAETHRATFDAIAAREGADIALRHIVRPDLLGHALSGVTPALEAEIAALVGAAPGPVLCTCSTLGPVAEAHGALRIDAPMMTAAAKIATDCGGAILMVYCLQSTLAPSVALLDHALEAEGREVRVHTLDLAPFWPLFEAGEHDAFVAVIARQTREAAARIANLSAIILAQASMAGAARLIDLDVPVLASPELAFRAMMDAR
ncbi:hypothetical protein K1T73_02595 [Roseovarius sp. SCSIO 43702]|uniref:hypothetical protein n=1 Tax=Roseovarius sp. SCSIO 43702 TaxID=2823043 RepID=UPI001C73B0AA|nr:hypothetical protein [Roseovarius sp. SCSIO 43702]QYX57315.1 hypothetical protein K1T73_02595 [Roseovarius sp. SCSIO 43702]